MPYFSTRSKVVDFSAESALLTADGKALCEIRKGKNPLYQRFKRDVEFSFVTEYFITANLFCQEKLYINADSSPMFFQNSNKRLTAVIILGKAAYCFVCYKNLYS